MPNIASEFREIATVYRKAGDELSRALELDDSQTSKPLIQSVLKNRDSLSRIGRMHSRVLHISSEWKKNRTAVGAQSWDEIDRLVENALQQALRLNQLCNLTAQKLQSARDKLGAELAEIGKGSRYLKSVKTAKNNYPKFIDSVY